MHFEWDVQKNKKNRAKHGVGFETACLVFDDPRAISIQDRYDKGEERWQTIGRIGQTVILLVAHAYRGDGVNAEIVRIISARKATPKSVGSMRKTIDKQQRELRHLAELPDADINTGDIPEIGDFSGAVRGRFYRPIKQQMVVEIFEVIAESRTLKNVIITNTYKQLGCSITSKIATTQQITLRIDVDLLEWFKAQGGKYQTHINTALREYVQGHRSPS